MARQLLAQLESKKIQFKDVLSYIAEHYNYTPSAFQNGDQYNGTDENQGSARIFSFAKMHGLSQDDTLHLFAEHYDSVLLTPDGNDHQNIRQFMQSGWAGVKFDLKVLDER